MRLAKVLAMFSVLCMFIAAASSSSAQTYIKTTLYEFHKSTGGGPSAGLIMDSKGNLYGTGIGLGSSDGIVFRLSPNGGEVEYDFKGSPDGAWPRAGLYRDGAGNLYGTTGAGGRTSSYFTNGAGTIFKISPTGRETVVYKFCSKNFCADGLGPSAELVSDASGNLYGTTPTGGLRTNWGGWGVIYEFSPTTGQYTLLHSFTDANVYGFVDGAYPGGSLVFDSAGNGYGVTGAGGTGTACDGLTATGCGTIYQMDATGKVTVLYSFTGVPDGSAAASTLIMDGNGVLYGTTESGGIVSSGCGGSTSGCGTVFKFDPNTGQETILYNFDGATGWGPFLSKLVMDSAGNLYGSVATGGGGTGCAPQGGCGVVYRISAAGVFNVLYTFQGGSDGAYPYGNLLMDAAGNLYGTTQQGGDMSACSSGGCGTVFRLTPQQRSGSSMTAVTAPLHQSRWGGVWGIAS